MPYPTLNKIGSAIYKLAFIITFTSSTFAVSAQSLTGIKTVGPGGDYTTITAAVAALNVNHVGTGGVTFNVAPGFTETLTATISLTETGTAANTIVFQKDPNGLPGANPLITAYTSGSGTPATALQDGLWRLIGADYITIDGIDLIDNVANTTVNTTMEYGYALYKGSATNGCQFVTISNCTITLNKLNNTLGAATCPDGSTGIISVNSIYSTASTPLVPTSFAGANANNNFYGNTIQNCNSGIAVLGYATSSITLADQNNDIGGTTLSTGNTISNFGGATSAVNPAAAIRTLAQNELNVSYNTINNNNGAGNNHESTLRGIYINTAVSAASTITNNTITLKGGGTNAALIAIENASGSTAVGNEVNISGNTITNCSYSTATTGGFYGIFNNAASPAILSINNNLFLNNSTAATSTGAYYPIYNTGAVTTTLNINNNSISGVTFTAATSSPFVGINNRAGTTGTNLSISNNDFTDIKYLALSSATNVYIKDSAATLSQVISSNTFTNLNVNTTGDITFIFLSAQVVVPATGNQVIDENSIVGIFTRPNTATSGAINLFISTAANTAGSVISNSNNDFSGITIYGAATITGWVAADAGSSLRTTQGNVFTNWVGGTGTITALSISNTGTTNAVATNLITNISSAGTITGINTIAGNDNIYSNTLKDLVSSGGTTTFVSGIAVAGGTTKSIYKNVISGLSANNSTTGGTTAFLAVNGIWISAGTTVNAYENKISGLTANAITTGTINGIAITAGSTISAYRNKMYNLSAGSSAITTGGGVNGILVTGNSTSAAISLRNNIIGNLKAPAANFGDAIRGISLVSSGTTSNLYIHYNTIYLNASSTGTNFGTSGIYHAGSSVSTTAKLEMINNIILNVSVPSGSGFTVAYRSNINSLVNYASSSNNNLFYAGTPATNRLIFYDGASDQLLSGYKTRVTPRDAASITENLSVGGIFLSTIDSSNNYLHLDDTKTTAVKSGGINISGVTADFDNDIRQGNPGYSGTGTAPDIGADEYAGLSYLPVSGTLNVGSGQTLTSLTNAGGLFSKINRVGLSGSLTVNITSDITETGTEALNSWAETGPGNYRVIIQPDGTTLRVISGDVLQGMIRLNGVDRIKIDGGAGKYLTFRNTNVSGSTGTAFTFVNGASYNTVRYCNIEAFTNVNNAVVLFSTSPTFEGGNSNNLVEYCNINGTVSGNNSVVGILSAGTNVSGFENTNDSIVNNNIFNYRDRGLEIKSTGSYGWLISGNSFYNGTISAGITYAASSTLHGIRVLGGSGYTITKNLIGGSAPSAGGTNATYATSSGNVSYQGILLTTSSTTPESNIKGNTIAKINVTSFPTATSIAFNGIETNGSNINIGGTATGDGNVIGSVIANSSIVITTNATKTTAPASARAIYCNSSGGTVRGNQVGGIDIKNFGSTPSSTAFIGIYINNPMAPLQVNNNLIGSATTANSIQVLSSSTAIGTLLTGISIGTSVGSAIEMDSNAISNLSQLSNAGTTTGGIIGINTAAKLTAELTITHNTFVLNTTGASMTSGIFYGIQNTGASASLKINNNILAGNTVASPTTVYNAIRNSGAIFNLIELNGNAIGNNSMPAITFSAANSVAQVFINNTAGSPTANLSISSNDIQNINYSASNGTGANTYILNTAATLSQFINNNSFTNLNVQSAGSATFITNSVIVPAFGLQNVNNNFISGTYSKKAGGTVTLLTSTATCATGTTVNINNNNFSNITLFTSTILNGLVNTDAGNSAKIIQGNIFTNWRAGTGTVSVMTVNLSGSVNSTSNNIIRNISDSGIILGIITTAGNNNINNNIVDSLFSLAGATSTVTGITVSSGTTQSVYQNTVSNLRGNGITTGSVRGILISTGTAVNVYQNKIFGLKADSLTTGTINGIYITGGVTVKVYRNKIYDMSSSGSAFAGVVNGILLSGSTANLTCTINNNIIGNLKTPLANIPDAIRGISILSLGAPSTTNVYYNTIYLNATSSATNFGSSGIYHNASSTATTSTLNLINNSITNISTPKGSGLTVAYRRNGAALNNYGGTSNNNMFYAGGGSSRFIFYDNTTSAATLSAYKAIVATRDAASVSEDLVGLGIFSSTFDSAIGYLHIDQSKTTVLRSGGVNISGFTDDYDGDVRFGNPGYSGNGMAPDIGADEFAGLQFLPFSGIYNVGAGQNYTSLTNSNGIFSKMNSLGFSGNVTLNIVSDLTETGAEALNQWAETGVGNYNLIIQPDATTARLISGDALAGLIRLNGPDRVKINGGTGRYLTFRNTNTTGTTGTAFTFINGATNDTLRYCKLEANANASNAVVLFGTAAAGVIGNSNNLLEFNNINGTVGANTSLTAIYSAGTAERENAFNTIYNNNIFNFRDRGIDIRATGSTGWTISANSFYNGDVSAINYPASSELHGIRILGGAGYSILNNYIGGNAPLDTGTIAAYASSLGNVSYQAIVLTTTSATPASNIKGNVIGRISVTCIPGAGFSNAFTGIETDGKGINIGGALADEGNLVGTNSANGSIKITTTTSSVAYNTIVRGIACSSTGGNITGNQVGGFDINNTGTAPAPSAFTGIYINNAVAPTQVNNNIIGSAGPGAALNSIRVLAGSSAAANILNGIEITSQVGSPLQLNANIIQNISNLSTVSSGSFTGINNAATAEGATITITNNVVRYISSAANNNSNSLAYTGISSGSPSSITNDTIAFISQAAAGTAAQIRGISVAGNFIHSITGNFLSDFSTASAKVADVETGAPAGYAIIGILNSASVAGQEISGNILANFAATSAGAINTAVGGIAIASGSSGNIYKNRIVSFTNTATGTSTLPGIGGIIAAGGAFNVYNNAVKLDNGANNNGVKIYGINHTTAGNWRYYYNTISIAGSASGTAARSAAFIRTINGAVILTNNILLNARTGTGSNFSLSNKVAAPAINWPASASNYNDLYSSNASTTGEWGNGVNNSFAQWQATSGGDANSVNSSASFIVSAYDLQPAGNSNCKLNNAGSPVTTPVVINTDINNVSRNATTPDIGAYEFSYTVFTISAANNSPVCSGGNVNLTSNPGTALSPAYSWADPGGVIFSTIQNPVVVVTAGVYTVTITDINGCAAAPATTTVSVKPAATAMFSYAGSPFCTNGGIIPVTFSGTTGGIYSSTVGLSLNDSTGAIILATSTEGAYTITYTVSDGCTTIMSTTSAILYTSGKWSGAVSTNWSTAANWACNIVPAAGADVIIPPGVPRMPVVLDSAWCNSLLVSTGDTLTIAGGGILSIGGTLTNNGIYNDNGTTNFNGTAGQQTFSGVATFNNLVLNNTASLLLPGAITIKNNLVITTGRLDANNFNVSLRGNWTNNSSAIAFTAGTAGVTFNGTTAQLLGGTFATTFNNLIAANTISIVNLMINASITGNLTVSNGTLDLGVFTANRFTAGGLLTVANNATLKIGGVNTYPGNYSASNLVVASTVEYSGTNQNIGNQAYGNLKLSSSSGAAVKTFPATPLAVVGNFISTVGTGTSVTSIAGANITVSGNVTLGISTTFNGGSFTHTVWGNWLNNGTFTGSTGTIVLGGSGTIVSGTGSQNFNNLTIAASGITFSSNNITLTGNLTTTGSGSFIQAASGTLLMTGTGKTISGSGISIANLSISGTVTTSISFTLTGNLDVSGSFIAGANTLTMSGASTTISGAGTIVFRQLYITGTITTAASFSISAGLTVSGNLSASAGTITFTGTSSLSGTANLFNIIINGTSLQLSSGSQLGIANILTISSGFLDVTTSGPNTVNFNGTLNQNINNITYSNLVLSNGNTKTATGPLTTLYDLTIAPGTTFNPSSVTHSISGNWINNGVFIPGTSTIQFAGTTNAFIAGATTFNILTINTGSSSLELVLQSNVSAAIVNMTNGRIITESNTLIITNTRTGNGIIIGNIQRSHAFTTGIAYAFEGPANTVTFSAVSSVSSITVSVLEGSISDFPFGGSIGREYDIAIPAGSYTATLSLHYEDDELNGNNESSMDLWHYNGSSWISAGKTANSVTSNYVEHSGLTDITNRWTFSDNANVVRWNGSVSTDWNTAANWTVIQGSGAKPPTPEDIVNLGGAVFTNQPTITNTVTVKSIIFGSAQAVILTLGSGGSLTTLGEINGNWTGNASHVINVNGQSLNANGSINLSEGTAGHEISLNIGTGTVTTGGSLLESGSANINFSGAGALNIFENFTYTGGTFSAGNGSVTYNGTENQHVANVYYNDLTINKTGGLASIADSLNIAGNLLISAGELDNFSSTTIGGTVTINAGDTLQNYHTLHVGGNWYNNGIYRGVNSAIFFEGAGTQTISTSTFNNLTVNKPAGSSAELIGNIVLNGDLIVTSGTLDIKTFDCNRSIEGGTFTLADSAVFILAGNNFPLNFSSSNRANASTVIANGTGSQQIFGAAFGNLIFRNSGGKTLISPVTVNGNLTIESGSNFDAGSSTLTLNGNWINNGTFTPSSSTVVFGGTGKTLSGNSTFNKTTFTGTYVTAANNAYNDLLHITSTGSLSSGGGIYTVVNGDLINNGVLNTLGTTTFTGTVLQTLSLIDAVTTVALIVNFNGSVSPVLNSTTPPQYGYLNINNTAGINPSVGWTILYALTIGNGALFNGGVSIHNIYGSVTNNGTITSSGTLNFSPLSAATLNLGNNFLSTGNVFFAGANAISLTGTATDSFRNVLISNTNATGVTPSSAWHMANNFTVNSGSTFNAGSQAFLVGGRILNDGVINSGTSTFTLNGTGIQNIKSFSALNNLTLNKASGVANLTASLTVNGVLNFVSGVVQTGNNLLIQPLNGSVTGAAQNTGWINGFLQKNIGAGSNVIKAFEVGDALSYTPASVVFSSVSTSGNLTVNTTPAEHPQIDLSGINKNLDVNRYWTLLNSGIGFTTAASTFNWVASDLDQGAATTNFKTSLYNGSLWAFASPASPLPTSIQATGLTSFGSFAIGEGFNFATWTGAAGTSDWFTSVNWLGGIPDATLETLIPAPLQEGRIFPVINTGIAKVGKLTIENNASLTVNATLQIKGGLNNNGTFDARNGTIDMNGSGLQTIPANTFKNNTLLNLIISNDVALAGEDSLTGTLFFGGSNKSFTTGGFLTLKSSLNSTARVADITNNGLNSGNSIVGNVRVERFLTAIRAWRFLTVPIKSTGAPSVKSSWQEGQSSGNPRPGYGTQITGGTVAQGFDQSPTNNSSLKKYNHSTNSWIAISTTNNPITDSAGYLLFVRGDKSINLSASTSSLPTTTVLRATGELKTGDQAYNVAATNFTVIGNPYASPLDINNVAKINSTNIQDNYYLWDPKISVNGGGYVVLSWGEGSYDIVPASPSGLNQHIQSGSAFFVKSANGTTAGTLIIKETDKSATQSFNANRGSAAAAKLTTNLYSINADSSEALVDGVLNSYSTIYSNSLDQYDASKITNISENLSTSRQGQYLSIERRQPVAKADTIFFNMLQMKVKSYRFQFAADNFNNAGLSATLEDSYTSATIPINLAGTTSFDFTVINAPASWNPARFRIIIKEAMVLPVTFSSIRAYEQNGNSKLEWKISNEHNVKQYNIERSRNGQQYSKIDSVKAQGTGFGSTYKWLDENAFKGNNYYRIKSIDFNGVIKYSEVVKVVINKNAEQFVLNTSLVTNEIINFQLINVPEGRYTVRLLNTLAQVIGIKELAHAAGSSTESLKLNTKPAQGMYLLEFIKSGNQKIVRKLVIQ